jgi:thioredoxin 1
MAPVLEQVAKEVGDKAHVFEMDIAKTDTYGNYGIVGIPTIIFFKGGQEAGRMIGVVKKDKIIEKLNALAV